MATFIKVELQQLYKKMKEEDPKLTIDEFIEVVREYKAPCLTDKDFQQHAVKMLLSTREVVSKKDEETKQPVQLGQ